MLTFLSLVTLPIAAGAMCQAAGDIFRRMAVKKEAGKTAISPLQFLWMSYAVMAGLLGSTYIVLYGFTVPAMLLPGYWRAVLCGAIANCAIHFLNTKASSLEKGEVSLTGPLQAMTPGLITLLAITLGEYPGLIGLCGVFLMMAGAYMLDWKKAPEHWSDYIGPLRRLRLLFKLGNLDSQERNQTIVVSLALASAAMGTLGLFFGGLYTRRGVDMQGLFLAAAVIAGLLMIVYAGVFLLRPDTENGHRRLIPSGAGGLVTLFACTRVGEILLVQPAFLVAYIGYVGTLKRLSVLAKVILGRIFLNEGEFRTRITAAVLIVVGAILISMDGVPERLAAHIEGWGI